MRDAVKGYLTLAAGLSEVTRQRATAAARALVAQGEATAEQVSGLVDDLVAQSRQNREAVRALVSYEVDRTLGRLGLASEDEVAGLLQRVRALEAELRTLRGQEAGDGAPVQEAAAKKAPARKSPAKKGAAAKAPAKKAPARKAAAAKSTAKKAPASKSPAKKAGGDGA